MSTPDQTTRSSKTTLRELVRAADPRYKDYRPPVYYFGNRKVFKDRRNPYQS